MLSSFEIALGPEQRLRATPHNPRVAGVRNCTELGRLAGPERGFCVSPSPFAARCLRCSGRSSVRCGGQNYAELGTRSPAEWLAFAVSILRLPRRPQHN